MGISLFTSALLKVFVFLQLTFTSCAPRGAVTTSYPPEKCSTEGCDDVAKTLTGLDPTLLVTTSRVNNAFYSEVVIKLGELQDSTRPEMLKASCETA